ncbi:MAG TPA: TonB family protein [Bryobacteraceae bacterium]|nr:TonB family protein [Bryobacteraceae bacterium]
MGFDADSGPNLLLDWQAGTDSPRWIRAGLASLAVHALLVPLLIAVAEMDTPAPRSGPRIVSNIQKLTLVAPADLTQKAPNRSKPAKEVNVEDLMPRPASEERLPPAPALRTFRPPVPRNPGPLQPGLPNVAEPPKIDAALTPPQVLPAPAGVPNAPPPKIQSEEQPKLAFETPGQRGPSTDAGRGQSKIQSPKPTVEQAMRDVARGGGQGGIVVGNIEQPPNIPEIPQLPPSPARSGSSLELLSDPMGVDFKPYLIQILALVRRNWFAVIPESARMGNRGVVQLQFIIDRSGQVPKLVIASPSGSQALDRAAVAGISASVPFPPLPPDYKGLTIRLQFAFKYNVQ